MTHAIVPHACAGRCRPVVCGDIVPYCTFAFPFGCLLRPCCSSVRPPVCILTFSMSSFFFWHFPFLLASLRSTGLHPVPWRRLQDRDHDPPAVQALPLPVQQEPEGRGGQPCRAHASLPHANGGQEPRREWFFYFRLWWCACGRVFCVCVCVCVSLEWRVTRDMQS